MPQLKGAAWIDLPKIGDLTRGFLTFGEAERSIPFQIRRAFWIYGAQDPLNARGGHAHREVEQILFTLNGSAKCWVDWAGLAPAELYIPTPNRGLYLPPLAWHTMTDFAPGTVILVLASGYYDEAEFIRDRAEYERLLLPRTSA